MWRTYKEAGRPWPVLDDDPIIDYMIMEAVYLKVLREERDAQKEAEEREVKERWKQEAQDRLKNL
jgi:hypothetical protein